MILGIPPILTNTFVGRAPGRPRRGGGRARGWACARWQVILRVELPLAAPTIMTGVRTAAINIFATATIASFVGRLDPRRPHPGANVYGDEGVLAGAILVALLALLIEFALAGVQRLADAAGAQAAAGAAPHRILAMG